jgi:hypothetical protein
MINPNGPGQTAAAGRVAQPKIRIPIPAEVAADALFMSDRTCCVCHKAGKQVQIHHINEDPSDNNPGNLAVLCLECHAQTQITGGFGRKLNANLVILYRDHWQDVVRMRRAAESLASELVKDSPDATPPESGVASPSAVEHSIGLTYRHLGIVITLLDAAWSYSVYLNNSGYRAGSRRAIYERVDAGSGAKFIIVATRVLNDAKCSLDLTCSYPIKNHLIDERNRPFDSIGKLYRFRGNPECNDHLQPGFTADMTWVYRVPLDAVISAFEFEDITEFSRKRTVEPTRIPLLPHASPDL